MTYGLSGEHIIRFAGEDSWYRYPRSTNQILKRLARENRALFVYLSAFFRVGVITSLALALSSCGGGSTSQQSQNSVPSPKPSTFQLSVSETPGGTVTSTPAGINCGSTCAASFNSGSTVTLSATPSTGDSFAGWSGSCSGSSATCTLTMNGTMSVAASFHSGGQGGTTGGIQEQINALPQPGGGVVTVSSNVAMTTYINLNNLQNITLLCINNASISVPAGSNIQVVSGNNFSNIVISGCTFIGPGANYPSSYPAALSFSGGSNLTIDHNTIQGGAFDGVYINNVTVVSAHDNVATKNGANGIECDATDCLLYSNTSTNNGLMGIQVYAPGNQSDITNNTAQGNGQNGINLQSDPALGKVSDVTVTDNISNSNLGDGINIDGIPSFPIDHVVVIGNTVQRNKNVGISISNTNEAIISGNTVQDNNYNNFQSAGGINCIATTNATIRQNTVGNITSSGQQQYGVKLNDPASMDNFLIENTLDGNLSGPFFAPNAASTASAAGSILLINNQ